MNRQLALPGLSQTLRDLTPKLTLPNPALTSMLSKLNQPDPTIAKAMRDALTMPPVTRKALNRAAGPIAEPDQSALSSREDSSSDGEPGRAGEPEGEEAG